MKKAKKKFFLIEIPVYNIDIAVSIGQTIGELKRSLEGVWEDITDDEGFPEEIPTHAGGMTLRRTIGPHIIPYAIVFPVHPTKQQSFDGHASISHEAFHVAFETLVSRGIFPSPDTEEAYAYLVGHLVREIYKNL